GPGVRAEPDDRRPAREGFRVPLGRKQPLRVPSPRRGRLRAGSFGRGRAGAEDQDHPGVPRGDGTFESEGYLAV
ncbi:MAG: hypothetical protein AVDCRST_MAG58-2305, partial [uncultured Rubrobacteraceae bacterium]